MKAEEENMIELNTLTAFLGWCSVINIGVLVLSVIVLMLMREAIANIHSKMFGLNQTTLPPIYMQYIGSYKIAILIFNLVPYISLKVMN